IQPWPMQMLVDHVLGTASYSVGLPGASSRHGLLIWIVGAGLGIFLLNAVMDAVLTLSWPRIGQSMVYDLAAQMLAHVQRLSLLFHRRHQVGDLMSRITGDSYYPYKLADTLVFTPLQAVITLVC